VTPFQNTLSGTGLLFSVYMIVLAEIIISNAVQFFDVIGNVRRHLVAPRSKTQLWMNQQMKGADVEGAERYSSMATILFLAVSYSSFFPALLFVASCALVATYCVDRFCLVRTWNGRSRFSEVNDWFLRCFMFPIVLLAKAATSAIAWTGYPYDNLCDTSALISTTYIGNWSLRTESGQLSQVTVEQGDSLFRFCPQSLFERLRTTNDQWVSTVHETSSRLHTFTFLLLATGVTFVGLYKAVMFLVDYIFVPPYKPLAQESANDLPSSLEPNDAYVPQVPSPLFDSPVLLCNVVSRSTSTLSSFVVVENMQGQRSDVHSLLSLAD